jgi:hypothetical protein
MARRKKPTQVEEAWADYTWLMTHPELRVRYAGKAVILHNRTVLGSGIDHLEAEENMRAAAAAENRQLPKYGLFYAHVPELVDFPPGYFYEPRE